MTPTAAPPAAPDVAAPPTYLFDVFVSYCAADNDWVCVELVPRLAKVRLRVAIETDTFIYGVPYLENVERAVRNSRFTIAVISPDWLTDRLANYTQVMAQTAAVAGQIFRFVPLLIRAAKVPPALELLTVADFTNPARMNAVWEALLVQLLDWGDGATLVPPTGASATEAFRTLQELMHVRAISALVNVNRARFEIVTEPLRVLRALKTIHDVLQDVQRECHRPITEAERSFP